MIIEFLKEEKCNEMFNLIKDCFNLEVNNNNNIKHKIHQ